MIVDRTIIEVCVDQDSFKGSYKTVASMKLKGGFASRMSKLIAYSHAVAEILMEVLKGRQCQ
jgi:hypothetical protein